MKRFGFHLLILSTLMLIGTAEAGEDKTEPQLHLAFDLVDGSHIIGIPGIESVPVQTSYAKMDVPLKEISTIKIDADHETASVDLQNGDKIKGTINLAPIKLETVFGKVTVGIEHIREIRVALTGGNQAEALKRGLVLYYSFDRDEGGKATDMSGNNNNGEVQGAAWVESGRLGGAYSFDGSGNRILINNHPSLDFGAGARTIGAWIRCRGTASDYQAIFEKGTNPGYAFRLHQSSDRAIEYFKSAGGNYSFFTSSHSIADEAWHHLAVVDHGDGTADFYKDGKFLETVTKENQNSDSSRNAAIGARPDVNAHGFNGVIDEVRIYNRALSEDEVRMIYDHSEVIGK